MPHFESDPRQASWQRTIAVQNRLRSSADYAPPDAKAPYGYFSGRPIIGSRVSKVIDGVYLGAGEREAIVVAENIRLPSGEMREGLVSKCYRLFVLEREKRCKAEGKPFRHNILNDVYNEVRRLMKYDSAMVDRIVEASIRDRADQKVYLDQFLMNHAGVCRHQALLLAFFLEKLLTDPNPEHRLDGEFSIDRNSVATPSQAIGAHVWVRFTSYSSGRVYILDPAQGVAEPLQNVIGNPAAWVYARPDELKAFREAKH